TVQHVLVVRLNVDGSLDSSFGPSANGIVTTAADRIKTVGYALALQPWDGKIVVAGSGWDGGNGNPTTMVVARYWP
ncbi:MAG TPA: hypothetical protein VLA93_17540, partial [Pyrinomonadaceae bacterium]|nr:hypothetical protein [Pyrinomonadaceae bacterium]